MAVPKAGAKIRASDWTSVFPTDTDAGTGYTPVVTQSNTPTLTVEYAYWMKVGRLVTVHASVSITSAGTASNAISITYPTAAGSIVPYRVLGSAGVFDASAATWYTGAALYAGGTAVNIYSGTSLIGAAGMTAALASGDKVSINLSYMTAS